MKAQAKEIDWLTVEEAAQVIGRSTRTVDRNWKQQDIHSRMEMRSGKRVRVFAPGDIERWKSEVEDEDKAAHRGERVLSNNGAGGSMTTTKSAPGGTMGLAGALAEQLLTTAVQQRLELTEPETPWVDMERAVKISGLLEGHIRQLIRDGNIRTLGRGETRRLYRADVVGYQPEFARPQEGSGPVEGKASVSGTLE